MLPGNVRISDVATVIGVAVGFQPYRRHFSSSDGWSTEVDGIETKNTGDSSPEHCNIIFDRRYTPFFFEPDQSEGRLLMPTSTAFWCLVGQRLVDFFGGEVDYNDCDSVDIDYKRRRKSKAVNAPTSDEAWYQFQERMMAVPPLTRAELEAFTGAAYDFASDNYEYNFDSDGRMVRGTWRTAEELAAA
jgi:hypothetical protein